MFVLQQIDTSSLAVTQKDSLFFQLGWLAYSRKQLPLSATCFLRVSPVSAVYVQCLFFAAYSLTFTGQRDSATHILNNISTADSTTNELKNFELAGLSLLKRDTTAYHVFRQQFTYTAYAFANEERHMDLYQHKLTTNRKKSPLLAGLYSALIPGSGKIYAGKKKQGIGAFLPVATLGALTYEAYKKGGIKSARFIVYSSIFSVFYIGNIWGSVLSVKIKQNEFNREYDNKILFDLHIPLRNFFN